MSTRRLPFGHHHSHYQPRDALGLFIRYEDAGRALGRHAVGQHSGIVVTAGTLRVRRR